MKAHLLLHISEFELNSFLPVVAAVFLESQCREVFQIYLLPRPSNKQLLSYGNVFVNVF